MFFLHKTGKIPEKYNNIKINMKINIKNDFNKSFLQRSLIKFPGKLL